jgi:hypothetical protein
MQGLRCTRAATGVVTAAVLGLQLLGLYACGRKGSDGVAGDIAAGGPPAVAGKAEGGRDRTAAAPGLKVGDEAPLFSLVGSDGRTYDLADYRGKQAVVLAWLAKAFSEA